MRLLILSPDAYSVFHTETSYIFGGIEVETGHHATGLARMGAEVFVATRDQGRKTHRFGEITLCPIPHMKGSGYWEKRKKIWGRLKHRLFGERNDYDSLEDLFQKVNPDIAYAMGMSPEVLRLAKYCKEKGIGFIFRIAHDGELNDGTGAGIANFNTRLTTEETRTIFSIADIVLSQTPFQQQALLTRFGKESRLAFPPIELNDVAGVPEKKYDVLWIGRSHSFKRPERFAAVATAMPDKQFCMVFNKVNKAGPDDWEKIKGILPANVRVIESVPADRIEELFKTSRVFLSTSLQEGFPNTFLQAAKNRIPVVSMGSDPNEMLSVHGAGILAGDDDQRTTAAILRLLENPEFYSRCAAACYAYVSRFHEKKVINKQYWDMMQQIRHRKSRS